MQPQLLLFTIEITNSIIFTKNSHLLHCPPISLDLCPKLKNISRINARTIDIFAFPFLSCFGYQFTLAGGK